jgi:acyl-CoA synthetase (NDP forming)
MAGRLFEELRPLFDPESIAIIGASNSPYKWGNWMVSRPICSGYRGRIFPINPKEKAIFGLRAYPNIRSVPEPVELAIITVPASLVPEAMRDCATAGVRVAIIISAGFAETGDAGRRLQDQVLAIARQAGIRFMGPNVMGMWSSPSRFNTAFRFTPPSGHISFVSQSGTMGGYLLEVASAKGYGFNKFISVGNQADLNVADYLTYLGEDPQTRVVVLYLEGIKEGERFIRVARDISRKKPIIIHKAGITEHGARATLSHTASMAGSNEVFESVCRQAGLIRTYDVIHAFDLAEALVKQPLPRGNRIGIIAVGGGHGVVTTDACGLLGLEIPEFPGEAVVRIRDLLLPHAPPPRNPVDLAADLRPLTIARVAELVAQQTCVDGIITMAPISFPKQPPDRVRELITSAEILAEIPVRYQKPLLATSMRTTMTGVAYEILRERDVPFYEFPEECARAMYGLVTYSRIKGGGGAGDEVVPSAVTDHAVSCPNGDRRCRSGGIVSR